MYHFALPLIVMTFTSLGGMTRYVRAAMIEALSMDYVRTARAKGLREKIVIYSHAWRNALLPVVTLIVGWFLGIFGGSVMIERIFSLNGMGKLYFDALNENDNQVILAVQMFYIAISLFGNLLIDLIYGVVDPRVRVNK
jgi:peptide/nickel transport system permease protein